MKKLGKRRRPEKQQQPEKSAQRGERGLSLLFPMTFEAEGSPDCSKTKMKKGEEYKAVLVLMTKKTRRGKRTLLQLSIPEKKTKKRDETRERLVQRQE